MVEETKPEGQKKYKYQSNDGKETLYEYKDMSPIGQEVFRILQNCEINRISINEAVDNNEILQAHYRNILHKELGIEDEQGSKSKGDKK